MLKLDVWKPKGGSYGGCYSGGREEGKGDGVRGRVKGMEEHHTDEPFKLLTPETTRLSAFWLIPGIVHPVVLPSPPSHTPQPVLSHPSLLRYYTRLTFATLTLFDCTETFWKTGNRFSSYILLLESILINFPSPLEISISIRLLYFSLLLQFWFNFSALVSDGN